MITSAQQLHGGKVSLDPEGGDKTRLFVDLDVCGSGECKECVVRCSYFYHPQNNGIVSVAELATYYLICRKCETPHCVNSCPVEALEQQKENDNLLIRHNMRCISCGSCSHACPYGTIYPENIPYIVHNCDFCLDRRTPPGRGTPPESRTQREQPLCITTCPYGALKLLDRDSELPPRTYPVGENLIIHSTHWEREKA